MPKLPRNTYRVELTQADDTTALVERVFEVTPILADILRGELEGPRHGIIDPKLQSVHVTVLWLWAAGIRTGQHELDFPTFKAACTNFELVKTVAAEVQGVPPTVPGGPDGQVSHLRLASDTPTTPAPGSTSETPTPTY